MWRESGVQWLAFTPQGSHLVVKRDIEIGAGPNYVIMKVFGTPLDTDAPDTESQLSVACGLMMKSSNLKGWLIKKGREIKIASVKDDSYLTHVKDGDITITFDDPTIEKLHCHPGKRKKELLTVEDFKYMAQEFFALVIGDPEVAE